VESLAILTAFYGNDSKKDLLHCLSSNIAYKIIHKYFPEQWKKYGVCAD